MLEYNILVTAAPTGAEKTSSRTELRQTQHGVWSSVKLVQMRDACSTSA